MMFLFQDQHWRSLLCFSRSRVIQSTSASQSTSWFSTPGRDVVWTPFLFMWLIRTISKRWCWQFSSFLKTSKDVILLQPDGMNTTVANHQGYIPVLIRLHYSMLLLGFKYCSTPCLRIKHSTQTSHVWIKHTTGATDSSIIGSMPFEGLPSSVLQSLLEVSDTCPPGSWSA